MQPSDISPIGRIGTLAATLSAGACIGAYVAANPAVASAETTAGSAGHSVTHTSSAPESSSSHALATHVLVGHPPGVVKPATATLPGPHAIAATGSVPIAQSQVGLAPNVSTAPPSPIAPAAAWSLLAWVRREFEQTFHSATANATATASAVAHPAATSPPFTVMTQNLYVGGDLGPIMRARTPQQSYQANTQLWNSVLATDYPTRSAALATEIEQTKPAVIGLQEATLWRDQLVSDVVTGTTTPNADHVVYDQVGLLIANLAADGTPYVVASRSTTSDTEGARINPDSPDGYSDIRRTSSDAILVRADQMDRISNPQSGDYLAKSVTVTSTGRRTNERGWVSVDYRLDDTHTVRIISTHLEPAVATPLSVIVQTLQAVELLGRVYASPHPVVVLGDLNSPDNIPLTPAYWILRAGLNDAWWTTHPFNLQGTCCQATLLDNPKSTAVLRLDHVLVRGVTANSATFTGTKPFRLTPPPLWVSDHFGVESTLHVTDTPAWLWLARLVPFLGPLI